MKISFSEVFLFIDYKALFNKKMLILVSINLKKLMNDKT